MNGILFTQFVVYDAIVLDTYVPDDPCLFPQGPERPWADRQWSLCIFDDLVEHAGPVSIDWCNFFKVLIFNCY